MNRILLALLAIAIGGIALQQARIQKAQMGAQGAVVERRTRGAEVQAVRPLRAKKALAGASAARAAEVARSSPESWATAHVPEEIHEALRDFDGRAPDGVRDSGTNSPGSPD